MTDIVIYYLKVCACAACFTGCYCLFLRRGQFHRWNRYYILAAIILSCCIPLLSIPVKFSSEIADMPPALAALLTINLNDVTIHAAPAGNNTAPLFSLAGFLYSIYSIVACLLLGIILKHLFALKKQKKQSRYFKSGAANIYLVNNPQAPYSFFSSVFWNEKIPLDSADGQCVLQHELVHIREKHSIDKLLVQVCCALFWLNPFFWLLRKELNLVHEFIADKSCVSDKDTGRLSALILCAAYPQHYVHFISPFFQTPIKRRLIMLNKNYSIKFKLQRKAIALLLPLIFLTFTVCTVHINAQAQDNSKTVAIQAPETTTNNQAPKAQSAQTVTKKQALKAQSVQTTITDEAIAVSQVEVKPKFQDSDEQAFLKWLFQNLQYPQEAKNKGLEGRIICSFTVNAQGKVVDIKVLRGIDPLLDDAAVKTISASPDWTPGQMKGKNVSVKYTIPLIFSLDKKKEEKAK